MPESCAVGVLVLALFDWLALFDLMVLRPPYIPAFQMLCQSS